MAIKHADTVVANEVVASAYWNADHTGSADPTAHAITSASHTSTATSGQMLKADANGLPVDATNTDAAVSAAVTASHAIATASTGISITGQAITNSDLGSAAVTTHNAAYTHSDIALNTAARHTQNTDTGTTGNTFTIDSDSATGKIVLDVALGAADKTLTITNTALTDNRVATFKDTSGTVAWTSDLHTQGTDTTLGAMTADINMNTNYQLINLQAPAANGESIRATAKITEVLLESATDLKHAANADTALGSDCVALDHVTAATDTVGNYCYGTGNPPAANTTTEGALFIKYTA